MGSGDAINPPWPGIWGQRLIRWLRSPGIAGLEPGCDVFASDIEHKN
jgi:hypothetical protein